MNRISDFDRNVKRYSIGEVDGDADVAELIDADEASADESKAAIPAGGAVLANEAYTLDTTQ